MINKLKVMSFNKQQNITYIYEQNISDKTIKRLSFNSL
jgi:hypothetical protein